MGCGRGPGGELVESEGLCAAAEAISLNGLNEGTNGGRLCWAVAGSFCGNAQRGRFAKDLPSCLSCEFFQRVRLESSPFTLMKLGDQLDPGMLGKNMGASTTRRRAGLAHGTTLNCWEYFHCGREVGGERADELGVCPAAVHQPSNGLNRGVNAGRSCWKIAGTFCFDSVQGTLARKAASCLACEFFGAVRVEEGAAFQLMRPDDALDEE